MACSKVDCPDGTKKDFVTPYTQQSRAIVRHVLKVKRDIIIVCYYCPLSIIEIFLSLLNLKICIQSLTYLTCLFQVCKEEKDAGALKVPLDWTEVERTSAYTGVSPATVYRIAAGSHSGPRSVGRRPHRCR